MRQNRFPLTGDTDADGLETERNIALEGSKYTQKVPLVQHFDKPWAPERCFRMAAGCVVLSRSWAHAGRPLLA